MEKQAALIILSTIALFAIVSMVMPVSDPTGHLVIRFNKEEGRFIDYGTTGHNSKASGPHSELAASVADLCYRTTQGNTKQCIVWECIRECYDGKTVDEECSKDCSTWAKDMINPYFLR